MNTMIETKNLSKKYKKQYAVENVSLTLNRKDIYGLIGKNGAGKSTLFKLLMGLAKKSNGEICFYNETDKTNKVVSRNDIGFMLDAKFFPYLNAYENINYYRILKGINDKKEVERVLKLVELDGIKKPFKTFSTGMRQRLGIANALLGNPEIIILDEPINGLDPQGIVDIRKLILKLNQKNDTTFIVSSHILSELDMMATKYGFINDGQLLREVNHEELNKELEKSLIIKVDNPAKAAYLIEHELKTTNFKVNNLNEIILYECLDQVNVIAKLLIDNDLELYKLVNSEASLEDYFLSLIGGNK